MTRQNLGSVKNRRKQLDERKELRERRASTPNSTQERPTAIRSFNPFKGCFSGASFCSCLFGEPMVEERKDRDRRQSIANLNSNRNRMSRRNSRRCSINQIRQTPSQVDQNQPTGIEIFSDDNPGTPYSIGLVSEDSGEGSRRPSYLYDDNCQIPEGKKSILSAVNLSATNLNNLDNMKPKTLRKKTNLNTKINQRRNSTVGDILQMQMMAQSAAPNSSRFRLDIHPDFIDAEKQRRLSTGLEPVGIPSALTSKSNTSVRFAGVETDDAPDGETEVKFNKYREKNAKRRVSIAFTQDIDIMLTDQKESPNKSNFYSKTRSMPKHDH